MMPVPGTHVATASERSVYESQGGALVFAARCQCDDGAAITAYQTLVRKDGTISEKTVATMRDIFHWDGRDPMWLQDAAGLDRIPFEIVVEPDVDQQSRPTVKVAWMNPVGGGRNMQKGDRASISSKYGAKFRAIAATAPARPTVAAAASVPVPVAAVAPPPHRRVDECPDELKPVAVAAGPTKADAWNAYCASPHTHQEPETRAADWFRLVDTIGNGKPEEAFVASDWAKVIDLANNPML